MTIDAYINPDFGWGERLIFFTIGFLGILLIVLVILGSARIFCASAPRSERRNRIYEKSHDLVQRFYEMIISATSVMSFSCAYVIINHIYSLLQKQVGSAVYNDWSTFIYIWENSKDFVLLLLICLSCLFNTLLDRLIIPLKMINKEEKASLRMLGMFYVIFILLYLNIIGDESEYNPVMLYYLGLMIGRFVYFDASFMDFVHAITNALRNLPMLILGLLLTGFMCYFGFESGYLLERNYYIVGAFYTHLFLLIAVFVLHHSRLVNLLARKPKNYDRDKAEAGGYEEYDDSYDDGDSYAPYEPYGSDDEYENYESIASYENSYENYKE